MQCIAGSPFPRGIVGVGISVSNGVGVSTSIGLSLSSG